MSNPIMHDQEPARKRQKLLDSGYGPLLHPAVTRQCLDISKYIPAGCLRVIRSQCSISSEIWKSCNEWRILWHHGDLSYATGHLQHVSVVFPQVSKFSVQHNDSINSLIESTAEAT